MEDSGDYSNEDESIPIKLDPEITYQNNWNSENMDDTNDSNQDVNARRRRSNRTRTKKVRYGYNEDNTSELSANRSELNDVDVLEPSSSASMKNTRSRNNYMTNRKHISANDPMGQVLIEMDLYDELYEFFKSNNITVDALRYMQIRHIDELFNSTRLGIKIIFEHRLKEWQTNNGNFETICNKINNQERLSEQSKSTVNQIIPEETFTNLGNLLTNAVQQTINEVLQDFKRSSGFTKTKPDLYNGQHTEIIPLRNIKVESSHSSEEIIIPDKMVKKVIRPSNKIVKVSDEILLDNQSIDITASIQHKRRKMDSNMSVQEILISSPLAQSIIAKYEDSGVVASNQRTEIVNCIIDYYLRNKEPISIVRCKEIAEEIVEIFPTESLDIYFYQDGRHKPPKGKLWDHYQYLKRSNYSRDNSAASDNNDKVLKWTEMEAICSQLKLINNERELLEKWKQTFDFRRHQLQTGAFSNWKLYFDEFPFCKQQNYAQFIDSDLETLYPNLTFNNTLWHELLRNFSTFFSNRIKHAKSKLLYDQLVAMENLSSHTDFVAIKVIELLHAILKANSNKSLSIEDAQRMFTVEVNGLCDLKKIVIERKKYCTEHNIQAKPYIAVVGLNKSYSHFSVILDSTGFSCDSYKDSLILCFNLYLFFDISFPIESLNVWIFIQKYFFNKPPLVSNVKVETFINDIKDLRHMNMEVKPYVNGEN